MKTTFQIGAIDTDTAVRTAKAAARPVRTTSKRRAQRILRMTSTLTRAIARNRNASIWSEAGLSLYAMSPKAAARKMMPATSRVTARDEGVDSAIRDSPMGGA